MRKGIPSKRELLDKLKELGWEDPQLKRLNMKLLQRMI